MEEMLRRLTPEEFAAFKATVEKDLRRCLRLRRSKELKAKNALATCKKYGSVGKIKVN